MFAAPPRIHNRNAPTDQELALIRGAYRAMARVGAQRLSLRRNARELGVSPGMLKYHFGDQETLMLETMRWALEQTVRRIHTRAEGLDDPEEAMAALLEAVFIDAEANQEFHLIYFDLIQYAARHSIFAKLEALARSHVTGSYAEVIRAGVDAGAFHVEDVAVAADQARAIVEGGFVLWFQDPNWRTSHEALHQCCQQAILRLLRGRSHRFEIPALDATPSQL